VCMSVIRRILLLTKNVCFFYVVSGDKFSYMVDFRDEGTFDPTTEMLRRDSRTYCLTWEFI
jgi:hypothetical protein